MNSRGDTGLTDRQEAEQEALAAMSEDDIDTSDIPEIGEFTNPHRGMFSGVPNRRTVPRRETPQDEPAANHQNDHGGPDDEQVGD